MSKKQRCVIVTGAGRGIGNEIAKNFVSQGKQVVCLDIDPEIEQKAGELGAFKGIICDISDEGQMEVIFSQLSEKGLVPEIVVNAAGVHRPKPLFETSADDLQHLFKINAVGAFIVAKLATAQMVEAKVQGSVVNFSSIGADLVTPNSTAYATSKGAVSSLTRAMALSLAPYGIRVNAIAPGPVSTPMNAAQRENPEYVKAMISKVPLGREGEPEDIVPLVNYLAQDSSWITGEVIKIDGGVSILR